MNDPPLKALVFSLSVMLTPGLVFAQIEEEMIRTYLEAHPEFLLEHPELVESALAEQQSRAARENAARRLELLAQLKAFSGISTPASVPDYQMIFFGFTHCPDICPLALSNMARALDMLGPGAKDIQPVFISVDTARDDAQALAEYVHYFGVGFEGLTGTGDLLAQTQEAFSVSSERVTAPGSGDGDYTFNHSAWIFLVDRNGHILNRYSAETDPEVVARSLRGFIGTEHG